MGKAVRSDSKDAFEFRRRLKKESSEFLRMIHHSRRFKGDDKRIGSELELILIDKNTLRVKCISPEIVKRSELAGFGKGVGPELATFNIELNSPTVPADNGTDILTKLRDAIATQVNVLSGIMNSIDGDAVPVMHGIWPMIRRSDISRKSMYPNPRYSLLADICEKSRGPASLHTDEGEGLKINNLQFMHEGMNTSFQLHYSTSLNEVTKLFNAAMLATPAVIAVSANSPFIFNSYVNDESRILLLEKSVDFRSEIQKEFRLKRARFPISFLDHSDEWFLSSLMEEVVLPVIDVDPKMYLRPKDLELTNRLPSFSHLFLHLSTVWHWIRLKVYPCEDDMFSVGIEIRPLPAGPTITDMVANAALYYGLIRYFVDNDFISRIKSKNYEEESSICIQLYDNFYDVAKHSIRHPVLWLFDDEVKFVPIQYVADQIAAYSKEGLKTLGVPDNVADKYISIILRRIELGHSPASLQNALLAKQISAGVDRKKAIENLCRMYLELSQSDVPFVENAKL